MRWGLAPSPSKYVLQPGDEMRPWKTYGQLWAAHRYTRGALDKLVLAGQVPFVDGEDLVRLVLGGVPPGALDAAARLGGDLEPHLKGTAERLGILRPERYYDMQEFLAFSAVDMLVAPPRNPGVGLEVSDEDEGRTREYLDAVASRRARELGGTKLVSAQRVCGKCQAEIPAGYVTPEARRQAIREQVESCPVCDATAFQLELLERSKKAP